MAKCRAMFLIFLVWTSLFFTFLPPAFGAETVTSPAADPVKDVDMSKLQDFLRNMDQETKAYMPDLQLSSLLERVKSGKIGISPQQVLSGILHLLFKEVVANAGLMAKLVILAVLCGVLQHLQNAFEGNVSKVAQAMSYLVLLTIALTSFTVAIDSGKKAIDDMVNFMQALLPVLLTLLVALGNFTSAAIFHPFILTTLTFMATLIKNVVFPLLFLGAVLAIINHISDQLKVSRLAGLLNYTSKALLGLTLTVFVGVIVVQGVAGSVADGVALRSAKFATDTFVPVVGRWFSDTVELVVSSALLLKNAVGIVGIIVVLFITVLPIIKIVSIMLIYRIAAALVQPLGNDSLSEVLQTMSSSLTLVFAAVASVGLMFFVAISIILATGNFTAMLR